MTTYVDKDVDILGVVILARHGDRQGLYQDPHTYTATGTELTPHGENQSYILGQLFRSRYVSRLSTVSIQTLSQDLFKNNQVKFMADAGGEGTVILDSATAIGQGLYPPSRESKEVLADGVEVVSPLGGYQFIPVESVEPEQDISLEGWTDCPNFESSVNAYMESSEFQDKANESASFLSSLAPYLGGRSTSYKDMWNIFDYMNVQYIHNNLFRSQVPPNVMEKTRSLANYHQWKLFSDPDPMHIRNIAGRTFIPHIVDNLEKMSNLSEPLGMVLITGSYKPFISLFSMLKVTENHPEVAGIVNYASSLSFEVRRPYFHADGSTNRDELFVRINFKNGTYNQNFVPYTMLGRKLGAYDIPLAEFTSTLREWSVPSLSQWCDVCGTTTARGCDVVTAAKSVTSGGHRYSFNPIASGFIGAACALVLAGLIVGALFFAGFLNWRSAARRRRSTTSSRLSAIIPGRNKGISKDAESQQQVNDNGFELRDDVSVVSRTSEKIEHS